MNRLDTPRLALLFALCTLAGCVTTDIGEPHRKLDIGDRDVQLIRRKLARVGLELIDPARAGVPPAEQSRVVAVRTIRDFDAPALRPSRGGYLFVGVDRHYVQDAREILAALREWEVGAPVLITARRNPYGPGGQDFWEYEVRLVLPN